MGDVSSRPTAVVAQLRAGLLALVILLVVWLSSWGISHVWREVQDQAHVRKQALATKALTDLDTPPGFVRVVGSDCPPAATICWHTNLATDEAVSKLSANFALTKSQIGITPDPFGGQASYILDFNLTGAEVVVALTPSYPTDTRRPGPDVGTLVALLPHG
jgi:hypothetical protein